MCAFSVYSCGQFLSSSGVMIMSNEGIDLYGIVSSTVDLIASSMEFMCCKKLSMFCIPCDKGVIHISFKVWVGSLLFLDFVSKFSMYKFATIEVTGDSMASPLSVHRTVLQRRSLYCSDGTLEFV